MMDTRVSSPVAQSVTRFLDIQFINFHGNMHRLRCGGFGAFWPRAAKCFCSALSDVQGIFPQHRMQNESSIKLPTAAYARAISSFLEGYN